MMPTRPRRSFRPPRSLVRFAALAIVLGAAAVALIATGQAGRLLSLSPENLSIVSVDISQLGATIERGALPVELLIIGAAVAIAIGTALPLLGAAVRRPRRSTALSGAAPVEATEPLEARIALPWPIEDAAQYPAVRTQSPGAFDVNWHARLPSDAPDPAEAEALAVREGAADVAGLTHALAVTRVGDPWSIGTEEGSLVGEVREAGESARTGPKVPRAAAVGTVAVGIAFSAGSAVGATLAVGAGAAIGLAFDVGAGAAIWATVTLLGARRS
jgi:hypothetical protein